MPLGSIISGAFDLFGGAQDRKFQEKWNKRSLEFANRQFTTAVQTRVADAKAAGIHPLFALGADGGGGSPTFSTGSSMRSGLAKIGEGVGRMVRGRKVDPVADAQRKMYEAAANRDQSQADLTYHQLRRAEHEWLHGPRRYPVGQKPAEVVSDRKFQSVGAGASLDAGTKHLRAGLSPAEDWEKVVGDVAMVPGAINYMNILRRSWLENRVKAGTWAAKMYRRWRQLRRRSGFTISYRDWLEDQFGVGR